jgi:thiosulfate dehydrogenase
MIRIQPVHLFGIAALSLAVSSRAVVASDGEVKTVPAAASSDDVTVSLCDGETVMTVPGLKPGQVLEPDRARAVAKQMMQSWRRGKGEVRWAEWEANLPKEESALVGGSSSSTSSAAKPAQAPAAGQAAPAAQAPPQPTKFTARDLRLWQLEEKKWIDEGYKNYHNAKAMGGTIGISCDMCHPDGANTHPETYPKFQSQTKKVALLRDMINWCIENPLKGKPLAENDPVLRSVEAYILSTRKGVPLEAGKH